VRGLAQRHLGPKVLRAPKSGFGVPLADWFRQSSFRPVLDRLTDPGHPAAGLLDSRAIAALLAEHAAGHDHGDALWLLVNVFLWFEVFVSGKGDAPAAPGFSLPSPVRMPEPILGLPTH